MLVSSDFYSQGSSGDLLMSAVIGAVAGFLSFVVVRINPLVLAMLGAVLGVFIHLWRTESQSSEEEAGNREYAALEWPIDEAVERQIFTMSQVAHGSTGGDPVLFQALLSQAQNVHDAKEKFIGFMAAAKVASREGEDRKAVDALALALMIEPINLVAQVRRAEALEYLGSAKEAISAYEEALQGAAVGSKTLRAFISTQALRVRIYGPKTRPAISVLRYMSY
jgi:hypothetical protein